MRRLSPVAAIAPPIRLPSAMASRKAAMIAVHVSVDMPAYGASNRAAIISKANAQKATRPSAKHTTTTMQFRFGV
jgi:hypothetical protein